MSASREKKKRQEFLASGAVDPKAAREAEAKAAARKSNILYGAIAAIFVVVAVGLVVYNSGIIQRSQAAVTIDGEKYTVPETSYYYQQAYQNFLNSETGYLYAAFGMLDTSAPLKSQNYSDTQTWDDYFKEQAVSTMKFVHAVKAAAKSENMSLDSADMETVNANIDSFKSAASQAGYSYKSYLSAIYGATMTPSVYESCLKDQMLVSKYATAYSNSLTFTEDEIVSYYNENQNSYDLVDCAYVSINGAPASQTDGEGNPITPTDEEKAAAMDEAKEKAEAVLAAYQESKDLEAAAEANNATCTVNPLFTYSSSTYGDWLYDSERKAGDVEVLVDEDGARCYVALFNSRQRNEALNYNVRHILINADSLSLPEGETATQEQLEAKAQEILNTWDGTEDGFAKLANQHSKDGGSNTNGGLYENVARGAMITEFNNWCYEDGRKPGDTGIIYSTSTGAHIMYFVGYTDTQYWHYACENMLRNNAYTDWYNSMTDSVNAEVNAGGMNSI